LLLLELDPTHRQRVDIAHADLAAAGGEAWAWKLPGCDLHHGELVEPQEDAYA